MRPRNKLEREVAQLSATLSETISASDAEWAKKKSETWDMKTYSCFTIYTNMKQWEVKRLYRIYSRKSKSITHYFFVEILREFSDGANKFYFGKRRMMGSYYDSFSFGSEIELRGNHYNWSGYRISDLFQLSMDSRSQHRGKQIACETIDPKELGRVICDNPVAENMFKTDDPLFRWLLYRPHPKKVCRAITLAKRHGFEFNERTTAVWFDMIQSIIYCKKDWHNPVYIAPDDLMATHDQFTTMARRKYERDAEARRRRRAEVEHQREVAELQERLERDKTANEAYIKRRKRFYPMVLTDGLISCKVLPDVQAFMDEGNTMDHCVFRCRYYEKPYSLILSARIGDQRIETIEVDLKSYTIKQCYGKHDQFTMYHDRIKSLVNDQMDVIKQYNRNRVKKQIRQAV